MGRNEHEIQSPLRSTLLNYLSGLLLMRCILGSRDELRGNRIFGPRRHSVPDAHRKILAGGIFQLRSEKS